MSSDLVETKKKFNFFFLLRLLLLISRLSEVGVYGQSNQPKTQKRQCLSCYKDSNDRALPERRGSGLTVNECTAKCEGFNYMGHQWTGECWCGNGGHDKHGDETGCNCEGSNVGGCKYCVWAIPTAHTTDSYTCDTSKNFLKGTRYTLETVCGSVEKVLKECKEMCAQKKCTAFFYQERPNNYGCPASPNGGYQICGFTTSSTYSAIKHAHNPGSQICEYNPTPSPTIFPSPDPSIFPSAMPPPPASIHCHEFYVSKVVDSRTEVRCRVHVAGEDGEDTIVNGIIKSAHSGGPFAPTLQAPFMSYYSWNNPNRVKWFMSWNETISYGDPLFCVLPFKPPTKYWLNKDVPNVCSGKYTPAAQNPFLPPPETLENWTAGIIINDQRWRDTDGLEIKAGKGGHLSRINGTWYWIGTNPDIPTFGGDLHLYSSDTLGEGTWAHHGIVVSADPGAKGARNCRLVKHSDGHYVIIGKGELDLVFYSAVEVEGPYTVAPAPNVQAYQNVSTFDNVGSALPGTYRHKFGGGSLFVDDDGLAYYITSRRNLDWETAPAGTDIDHNNRNVGIYRLQADWLDFEENTAEVYWAPNIQREAMFLFKRHCVYYMLSSRASGYRPSNTFYRTAAQLSGPWSDEAKVTFVPATTRFGGSVRSHGSQFRYFVDIGGDNWMFGGDRYPVEDPKTWPDPDKGRHIRMPVVWQDDVPTVYWRREWDIGLYNFMNTTSEPHDQVPGVTPDLLQYQV